MALMLLVCFVLHQPLQPICGHADDGACHAADEIAARPALSAEHSDEDSPADDCCAPGCQDCGLPCCMGSIMILTAGPSTSIPAGQEAPLSAIDQILSWVDADPLDHPPRA
jgi:hypothetical protein